MGRKNPIEKSSRRKKERSVIAERFIKTLKNQIHNYMTSVSKTAYINELDGIVNKYNNAYHSTIKMKPVNVKSNICLL